MVQMKLQRGRFGLRRYRRRGTAANWAGARSLPDSQRTADYRSTRCGDQQSVGRESGSGDDGRRSCEQSSEAWRRLRMAEQQNTCEFTWRTLSSRTARTPGEAASKSRRGQRPRLQRHSPRKTRNRRQRRRLQLSDTSSSGAGISTERLRDYVGAFVLAGLDPHVGSEYGFLCRSRPVLRRRHDEPRKNRQGFAALRRALAETAVSGSMAISRSSHRTRTGCR